MKITGIQKSWAAALLLASTSAVVPVHAEPSPSAVWLDQYQNTSVLDFSNFYDYQIKKISDNWELYPQQSPGSRHVGYGWSFYYYAGLTRPANQVFSQAYDGTLEITRGGGQFQFKSVSFFGSFSDVPYELTGWLGTERVFSSTGSVPGGGFESVANPDAGVWIDKLDIKVTSPGWADCGPGPYQCGAPGSYVAVSNIFVTRAVPEPDSLALLGMGGAVAVALRRRRRVN